jgi:hypothetical protein
MSVLGELVIGDVRGAGKLSRSLRHLGDTLTQIQAGLHAAADSADPTRKLVTPFLARSLVEVGCTSLIARLDGFRILTLAEIQSQSTYNHGARVAAAVQWTGDVLSADGAIRNMWDGNKKPVDMSRALLGDYNEQIIWRPAFTDLLDFMSQLPPESSVGPWSEELRNLEPRNFLARVRGEATSVYSTASKGVHHEFVLSFAAYYDDASLGQLRDDALRLVATLGLVMNFADHAAFALSRERAFACYEELQK